MTSRGVDRVRLVLAGLAVVAALTSVLRAEIDFVFPTPNTTWARGDISTFVQATVSGDPESGLFGCTRSGGAQFHEGLDVKPMKRDRTGEAADPVFAVMDGIVRHVSLSPGKSSYGRYIVIEHPDQQPAVYTLYAHLARAEAGIRAGTTVRKGQVIGTMGRSAGGYAIPPDRAHLHFEVGLRLTDDFQFWFNWKKFGSPNDHGAYNGMNLMGVDPLDFLRQAHNGRVASVRHYFDRLRPVVTLRIATTRVPDFIRRYPALLRKPITGLVAGWEIECNATGLPFAWTPLSANEVVGLAPNQVRIVESDLAAQRAFRCKQLVRPRRGADLPADDLQTMLQLVFGLRR